MLVKNAKNAQDLVTLLMGKYGDSACVKLVKISLSFQLFQILELKVLKNGAQGLSDRE